MDNQLGPALRDAASGLERNFGSAIAAGELLLILEVRASGSTFETDLFLGATADGEPPRLAGEMLAPGQALRAERMLGRIGGDMRGGRMRAGPGGILFPIISTSQPPASLSPAYLYADVGTEGIDRGVLGGGFLVEDVVAAFVALDPEAFPESLVRSVAKAQADIEPDASGDCTRVSSGWTFTAVPARITR